VGERTAAAPGVRKRITVESVDEKIKESKKKKKKERRMENYMRIYRSIRA